jgi:Cu+-exporting ATPase
MDPARRMWVRKVVIGSRQPASTAYTCTMHPEVRQNVPGKCPKCGMDLAPAEEKK